MILLAGITGNLGGRIAKNLLQQRSPFRAVVRAETAAGKLQSLKARWGDSVEIIPVDFNSPEDLTKACAGCKCVVSALSGLRPVIIQAQTQLLEAAVRAEVPRFIPSDFAIDYTKLPEGSNRNLDLRREFKKILDEAPIAGTSIFNGAFTDMLTGQAPIVLFRFRRVLYWGNPDQKMDFTSIDDTARFTAAAAIDAHSPRALHIAGDQISARELTETLTELSDTEYKLQSGGGLTFLKAMSQVMRALSPKSEELYPPWQGMQYLHNMYSGLAQFSQLDNDRYFRAPWTRAKDILRTKLKE